MVSVLNRSRGSIFWGLGGFRVEEGDWDDISAGWEGGEGEGGGGEGGEGEGGEGEGEEGEGGEGEGGEGEGKEGEAGSYYMLTKVEVVKADYISSC